MAFRQHNSLKKCCCPKFTRPSSLKEFVATIEKDSHDFDTCLNECNRLVIILHFRALRLDISSSSMIVEKPLPFEGNFESI